MLHIRQLLGYYSLEVQADQMDPVDQQTSTQTYN